MGTKQEKGKAQAWLRCSFCYGTGYRVKAVGNHETISGKITDKHCEMCKGSGFLSYE